MTNPITLLTFCFVFFCVFVFLLVQGIRRRSFTRLLMSAAFLITTVITACWFGILIMGDAYKKGKKVISAVSDNFKPRTGQEIYVALFGKTAGDCVTVTNSVDQVVPRLDCCIWLQFNTCPAELRRIIVSQKLQPSDYHSIDTAEYMPDYSPKPAWWPLKLSPGLSVLRNHADDDPNHDHFLIFAKDSTRAYYCDMAE